MHDNNKLLSLSSIQANVFQQANRKKKKKRIQSGVSTFIDAFQGCYTFQPFCDSRFWPTSYLLLRVAALAIFAVTKCYIILVDGDTGLTVAS